MKKNAFLSIRSLTCLILAFSASTYALAQNQNGFLTDYSNNQDSGASKFEQIFLFPHKVENSDITLDSVIDKRVIQNQLQPIKIVQYTYNDNGYKVVEETSEFDYTMQKVLPKTRQLFTYNNFGQLETDTTFQFLLEIGNFVKNSYTIRQYPSDGDNGVFIATTYKWLNENWSLSKLVEVEMMNGNVIHEKSFYWNNRLQRFTPYDWIKHEYNARKQKVSRIEFKHNGTHFFQNIGDFWVYQDTLLLSFTQYRAMGSESNFRLFSQSTSEYYDTGLLKSQKDFSIDLLTQDSVLTPVIFSYYRYDEKERVGQVNSERWDRENNEFLPYIRRIFSYDAHNNISNVNTIIISKFDIQRADFHIEYNYDFEKGTYISEEFVNPGSHMMTRQYSVHSEEGSVFTERNVIYKINNVNTKEKFSDHHILYPNPVSHTLNINNEDSGFHKVNIYNQLGFLVYKGNTSGSSSVDVQHLQEGVYYLQLIHPSTGQNQTLRFVKL